MPQTLMTYTTPELLVADTQAGLDAGDAFECQINSARIDPTVSYNTVPATGCSGPTQSPGAASWGLTLTWLDDWSTPGGGLSYYAYENRGKQKWVRLVPDKNDPAVMSEGLVFIAPGGIGGTFGDGSAGQSTGVVWPYIGDPTFAIPPALPLDDAASSEPVTAPDVVTAAPVAAR